MRAAYLYRRVRLIRKPNRQPPMTGVFSAPKMPPPEPAAPPPTRDDPAVEESRRKELLAAAKAKGRSSTLLTGGEGVSGDAPVARKRLLGE